PPFDLVEAEEELSGGYNMEYSSIDFAWFYLAEYAALVTNSAIIVTLWLGGPDGPRIAHHSIGPFWFVLKLLIILYIYVWIRATLPRIRYDQLMDLGWKRLIPGSLAMLMIVAGFQVSRTWGFVAFGASVLLIALLMRAIDVGHGASEVESARDEAAADQSRARGQARTTGEVTG
ncbi:MAG TPA: complex I subunit 1 family protein, partial [Acidimicrobiales bacterium]|nr:complex I subunit 1 family protein [Acidimicrobiales bacterium]